MDTFVQAIIMSFREGLEAFLVISILLKLLDKIGSGQMKKHVWRGTAGGVLLSLGLGLVLIKVSHLIGELATTAKLWESAGAFIAVILVTTFIIWMIKKRKPIQRAY